MKGYRAVARRAVESFLRARSKVPVFSLYALSVVADEAARNAGKKGELFSSLSEYETVLPPGARVFWESRTGLLSVRNPYCSAACGREESREAVLLPGPFDCGVDMGPQGWADRVGKEECV